MGGVLVRLLPEIQGPQTRFMSPTSPSAGCSLATLVTTETGVRPVPRPGPPAPLPAGLPWETASSQISPLCPCTQMPFLHDTAATGRRGPSRPSGHRPAQRLPFPLLRPGEGRRAGRGPLKPSPEPTQTPKTPQPGPHRPSQAAALSLLRLRSWERSREATGPECPRCPYPSSSPLPETPAQQTLPARPRRPWRRAGRWHPLGTDGRPEPGPVTHAHTAPSCDAAYIPTPTPVPWALEVLWVKPSQSSRKNSQDTGQKLCWVSQEAVRSLGPSSPDPGDPSSKLCLRLQDVGPGPHTDTGLGRGHVGRLRTHTYGGGGGSPATAV